MAKLNCVAYTRLDRETVAEAEDGVLAVLVADAFWLEGEEYELSPIDAAVLYKCFPDNFEPADDATAALLAPPEERE
jgi:hypothetical protein